MNKKLFTLLLALVAIAMTAQAQNTNGHEYVDLGLPSGTLWATCNVGASKPEEYGNHFAWGETSPKEDYTWDTYQWYDNGYTKYNGSDGKTELDLEDDAANANWGGDWQMPSLDQMKELVNQCTWEWETLNGAYGRRITGPNGNSIFLPAAGWRSGTSLNDAGTGGGYWSRMRSTIYSNGAYHMQLGTNEEDWDYYSGRRSDGQVVRAVVMKKQNTTLLLNAENFPDANFRAALAAELGISEGDEITEAKIAATTTIDVSSKSIADLKGIEHFTALETLSCGDNQLTSLNVSNNTALTGLSCGGNQLTSLDVSKNTALTWLSCGYSQLTSLDVSKNTALTSLGCIGNQLTSLEVSKNTALTELLCYFNQLTSLDVSRCTALKDLECSYNQLTSLDVSKNTALTGLGCSGNRLTSLDVSQNTALTWLNCNDNQLTSLDVSSKNTALERLNCRANKIKSKEMDALVESLPMVESGKFYVINTKYKNEGNVCTKSQVGIAKGKGWTVYDYNGGNSQEYEGSEDAAESLLLNAENFPDANFRAALASWLGISEGDEITAEKIAATTTLYVTGESIADLTGIEHFTALKELYCYDNQLTTLDVSKNTALTKLSCFINQLTSLDVSQNIALTGLYCGYNQLTALDVSKNIALTGLDCSSNQLTSLDVSKNTALTRLYCDNNQLTALDVSQNTALTRLSCSGNQLTSLDVSKNTALTELYCYSNQIKGEAMDALVASLLTVESGKFFVIDTTKNEKEGNVITKSQVAIAKEKGWTVYDYNGSYSNRQEYEGSDDDELEAMRAELLEYVDKCRKELQDIEWRLEQKATYEQAPNLYNRILNLRMLIDDVHMSINNASTIERLMDLRYKLEMLLKSLYELREEVEAFELDIDPVDEDDNIDFGTDMNEGDDLNGNVIGDIYYNINTGDGGYDAAEGCIVVKKPTDDGTVGELEGKDIFGEDFKSQFTGIVFKVPAGKGTIKVNAETTGNMLLKVKIGNNDPVEMELNGKLKVTFPYNVSETTLVYIYAGAANEAKGFGAPASGDAALKIYGIEFIRDNTPTDIDSVDSGELTVDSWYTIDGKKLAGEPKEKGIYIRNGRKVIK